MKTTEEFLDFILGQFPNANEYNISETACWEDRTITYLTITINSNEIAGKFVNNSLVLLSLNDNNISFNDLIRSFNMKAFW